MKGTVRRRAGPGRSPGLSRETAGWRGRPNPVSALESSAICWRRQSMPQGFLVKSVPWQVPVAVQDGYRRLRGLIGRQLIRSAVVNCTVQGRSLRRFRRASKDQDSGNGKDGLMAPRYLAFDIESAKDVPGGDFNWRLHRPLGGEANSAYTEDSASCRWCVSIRARWLSRRIVPV